MKKKLLLISMVACILAVALVGGSLAYVSTVTNNNSITTTINTPQLQVQLLPEKAVSSGMALTIQGKSECDCVLTIQKFTLMP